MVELIVVDGFPGLDVPDTAAKALRCTSASLRIAEGDGIDRILPRESGTCG